MDIDDELLTPKEVKAKGGINNKIKRWLLIIAPILLLIVVGGYFLSFVINAPKGVSYDAAKTGNSFSYSEPTTIAQNLYLELDPITVGLSALGSKKEFLKMNITLKINSEEDNELIVDKVPLIRDALIVFLRSLRSTDFNGSRSIVYLKEEMLKRVNKILDPVQVQEILFKDIVVN